MCSHSTAATAAGTVIECLEQHQMCSHSTAATAAGTVIECLEQHQMCSHLTAATATGTTSRRRGKHQRLLVVSLTRRQRPRNPSAEGGRLDSHHHVASLAHSFLSTSTTSLGTQSGEEVLVKAPELQLDKTFAKTSQRLLEILLGPHQSAQCLDS